MDFMKKDVGAFVFLCFCYYFVGGFWSSLFFCWRGNEDFLVNTNISSVRTNIYN